MFKFRHTYWLASIQSGSLSTPLAYNARPLGTLEISANSVTTFVETHAIGQYWFAAFEIVHERFTNRNNAPNEDQRQENATFRLPCTQ